MKLVKVLVAMISLLGGALRGASVQSGQDRIRVQTSLVSVPVMVSDQLGRSIVGLKQEDFVLYDDGVPQRGVFRRGRRAAPDGAYARYQQKHCGGAQADQESGD